jgi:hypothetical protein
MADTLGRQRGSKGYRKRQRRDKERKAIVGEGIEKIIKNGE